MTQEKGCILFLCVANSARSQMAEGIARKYLGDHFVIMSAGSKPSKALHPITIEILTENNLRVDVMKPKSIDQLPSEFMSNLDFVITLCADEACPVTLTQKAKRIHWLIPDPLNAIDVDMRTGFRRAYTLLEERIEQLASHLYRHS